MSVVLAWEVTLQNQIKLDAFYILFLKHIYSKYNCHLIMATIVFVVSNKRTVREPSNKPTWFQGIQLCCLIEQFRLKTP